jgi:hypothetical protein
MPLKPVVHEAITAWMADSETWGLLTPELLLSASHRRRMAPRRPWTGTPQRENCRPDVRTWGSPGASPAIRPAKSSPGMSTSGQVIT